jgi:hypothetical protein
MRDLASAASPKCCGGAEHFVRGDLLQFPVLGSGARPPWAPGFASVPGAPAAAEEAPAPFAPTASLFSFCMTVLGSTFVPAGGIAKAILSSTFDLQLGGYGVKEGIYATWNSGMCRTP